MSDLILDQKVIHDITVNKEDDIWNINEELLDNTFIGMWTITILDSFNTPKAGSDVVTAVVRSKVLENYIVLYSHIPKKFDVSSIVMDGSVGIYSKITEKIHMTDIKGMVGFMFLYAIKSTEIIENKIKYKNGYIIKSKGEIDDIVYNAQKDCTVDIIYYMEGFKNSILSGMKVIIPVETFNYYVKMRDVFYNEYTGAKAII